MYNPFSMQRILNPTRYGLITFARGEAEERRDKLRQAQANTQAQAQAQANTQAQAEAQAEANAQAQAQTEERQAAIEQSKLTREAAVSMQQASVQDPGSLVTPSQVAQIDPNAEGATIAEGTGQLGAGAPQITTPAPLTPASIDSTQVAGAVGGVIDGVSGVQGVIGSSSQVEAQSKDPSTLSSIELEAEQIGMAQVVSPAAQRTLQTGEMISGSAVDMAEVNAALEVEAAQANPSQQATIQGQLGQLMQSFDGTSPPAWAAGALRNASAQMAQRGLGASSMAGQALVQAAMEAALPIAMADAQTFAKFESQNLSNRQQTAMFAAEQRANFLSMDFNQEFQTRVANASKISDVANMNFTAEQQIALENARMAQTVDISNLNAKNAKMMADAAAMSQMDMQNLNNRQQASVMNAQSFLAMDMKNMDFSQQTELFKAQSNIQAIFSDQAAVNASKQFNAASENQTNQFFANMSNQVQQFNAGMDVQRDQFNSQNALLVAQANAQWRQNSSTINTAAQNQSNLESAKEANGLTQYMLDTVWQRERDIMDYAFKQSESATDRALSVFLANESKELAEWESGQKSSNATKEGLGYLFGSLLG
tara:strand:+ start:108 stop:1898 length:1791 start_codon:yes stop_codon:yes gene_type:complete